MIDRRAANTSWAIALGLSVVACESPVTSGVPELDAATEPQGWQWTNPSPNADSLFGVTFRTPTLGLAAGVHNLLRTVDGGAAWHSVSSPLDYVEAIHFTSDSHVVAVGFNFHDVPVPTASAMTSDDAGLTWTLVALPIDPRATVFDLGCDGARCVVVGSGGAAARSDDGGVTWIDITTPLGTQSLYGVAVRGSTIFAVGNVVRVSHDAGASWSAPAQGPTTIANGIAVADSQLALAAGTGESIWRTTDGGVSWAQVHAGPRGRAFRRIQMIDATHAIAVGVFGLMAISSDGGATWRDVDIDQTSYLWATATRGANVWVVGTRGVIYRSSDFGATWASQTPGHRSAWWGAAFPTPKVGYLAGELGEIIKTTDAGRTWTLVHGRYAPYASNIALAPLMNSLHGIAFVTPDEGWAVGDAPAIANGNTLADSVILHTADGGASWQLQSSGVRGKLSSVGFANTHVGWAVGTNLVLKTIDGGRQWTRQTGLDGTLTDIAVLSPTEAWICGWQLLAHTTDGGQTWTKLAKPIGIQWSLEFFDPLHAISAGASIDGRTSAFELTEDGGKTWTTISTDQPGLAFAATLAPDLKHGVAVAGSNILRTDDGGHTWTLDAWPTNNQLFEARAVDGGFVVAGEFGAVLRAGHSSSR